MKFFTATIFLLVFSVKINMAQTEKWDIYEVTLEASFDGNPYTEVEIYGIFSFGHREIKVAGFYDGNDTYKIRFMPDEIGEWKYITSSNLKRLNNKKGKFNCKSPSANNHGPVKVRGTFDFEYADGKNYYPLGTTCYAWTSMPDSLVNQTISTLKVNAFNKIRMCVFPKIYSTYINNDPPEFPFTGNKKDGWNFNEFNPLFFQRFERCVDSLRKLNIEADIIIFHPYDGGYWGFDRMPDSVNDRYLKYLIARLGAYRNVWWSLSNEFEGMKEMEMDDWDRFFKIIMKEDPYQHLRSIHNAITWYDYTKPWVTHLSLQTIDFLNIQKWRNHYQRPIVIDECVYEGNLPFDWGNLTAEEMVRRCWITYVRGGYSTHGETYINDENILWWSKGGKLYGESPKRLAFLREVMENTPREGIVPHESGWNKTTFLYKENDFFLYYYDYTQMAYAQYDLPEEKAYKVTVLDTWDMKKTEVEGTFSGKFKVPLPQKPYMAVMLEAID